jgi:hypothetical protein
MSNLLVQHWSVIVDSKWQSKHCIAACLKYYRMPIILTMYRRGCTNSRFVGLFLFCFLGKSLAMLEQIESGSGVKDQKAGNLLQKALQSPMTLHE